MAEEYRDDVSFASFKNVVTFNMDEYVGLPKDHPESYHAFMLVEPTFACSSLLTCSPHAGSGSSSRTVSASVKDQGEHVVT